MNYNNERVTKQKRSKFKKLHGRQQIFNKRYNLIVQDLRGIYWVAYINEKYSDSYVCPTKNLFSVFVIERNELFLNIRCKELIVTALPTVSFFLT